MEEVKQKNKKQSFMSGVLTILIAQIIIKVLGLIYRLVITNIPYFGDEGNGLYSSGYQIYMLLLAIASIGVPSAIAKLVSERIAVGRHKEAHEIFKTALGLFGIIGFIGTCILFFGAGGIAKAMGNPDVEIIMVVLSPAVFFVAVAAVIKGYFNGMYNMKVSSNSQMLEQVFKSSLTILFVVLVYLIAIVNPGVIAEKLHISEENVTVTMAAVANAASTVATAISCGYLFLYYQRVKREIWKNINSSTVEYKKERKLTVAKRILAVSIPISLASIVSALNRNVDTFTVMNGLKVALQGMFDSAEAITAEATRLYGILSGRVDTLIGLPTALNVAFATALVPAISESMAKGDKKTARKRITFSMRTTMLIAFPCAVGMCVLAKPILRLLYPNIELVEAPLLLQISSFSVIFTLINQTMGGALQGLGKVLVPAGSLACGAVVKLILNLILIRNPEIGVYGAAISSVISSIVVMTIEMIILTRILKFDSNIKEMLIKPIFATALMGFAAWGTNYLVSTYIVSGAIATLIAIGIAVLVYAFAVIKLEVFSREDYHMLPYGDKIHKALEKVKLVKP
ncbi:MAG: polysaccharide biosynthesis protein [Clostridia bacterium]|nr:polysaccharide biosynthesis protein [Clostridia bacterium]